MSEPIWVWEPDLKRYRDTATGRFIGITEMQDLRNEFIASQQGLMRDLVRAYVDTDMSHKAFSDQIKLIIKNTYIDLYAMGIGGRNNMTQADWGSIGGMLKEQYQYLHRLLQQIEFQQVSPAQIVARLNMYINSANEALWRALGRDLPLQLPAYPGDGSTECLTNCRCEWDIQETEMTYDCFWMLGEAEHCPDCVDRSQRWAPYVMPKGGL